MHTRTRALMIATLCVALSVIAAAQGKRGMKIEKADPERKTVAQNTPAPGDSVQTITVGGVQRTFIRHIPTGYDGSVPVPLVVVLHGRGGNAKGMEENTGFSAKADAEKFVVIY